MKKAVIAYVPVLHDGYRKFFERHADADEVFIFGKSLIKKFDYLAKEIRQLAPELVRRSLLSWGMFPKVSVLEEGDIGKLSAQTVVMPDEDVCRSLAGEYFKGKNVVFDTPFLFLRWHKTNVMEGRPVEADQTISREKFDREIMRSLDVAARESTDWWRRNGAALIKDGKVVLVAHNEHQPSAHTPYADGDPRNALHKGVGVELSTSIHAEARIVAEAARQGIKLEGCSIYTQAFPCPPCAKQIAFAGIKKLYYENGYSLLDQERVLRAKGVEIIHVEPEKKTGEAA